jgi:hypothetical protein
VHLAGDDGDALLLVRMQVLAGNLAVRAERVAGGERLGGRREDTHRLAGDRILEDLVILWRPRARMGHRAAEDTESRDRFGLDPRIRFHFGCIGLAGCPRP